MKTYNTIEEVKADIKDGVLTVNESVTFNFSLTIEANLKIAGDINSRNINAGDIDAWDINAGDIDAWNINAGNINAMNIDAGNINAGDINAGDIDAMNIDAGDINAGDIQFYAVAFANTSFACKSIMSSRKNSKFFCLDSEVKFK
jgi:hypothetical protein